MIDSPRVPFHPSPSAHPWPLSLARPARKVSAWPSKALASLLRVLAMRVDCRDNLIVLSMCLAVLSGAHGPGTGKMLGHDPPQAARSQIIESMALVISLSGSELYRRQRPPHSSVLFPSSPPPRSPSQASPTTALLHAGGVQSCALSSRAVRAAGRMRPSMPTFRASRRPSSGGPDWWRIGTTSNYVGMRLRSCARTLRELLLMLVLVPRVRPLPGRSRQPRDPQTGGFWGSTPRGPDAVGAHLLAHGLIPRACCGGPQVRAGPGHRAV